MALPYPSGAKRIRFMPKTYTFHAQDVYVSSQSGYTLWRRLVEGGLWKGEKIKIGLGRSLTSI